jgi:hypothetical protein
MKNGLIYPNGVIAALLGIILFLRMCSGNNTSNCPQTKCDTIVKEKRDTVYLDTWEQTGWIHPEPAKTIVKTVHDTLEITQTQFVKQVVDTAAILKDFFAKRYYKDSLETSYGRLWIEDTVSKNKIVSRRVTANFREPVITKTVTMVEPKHNQIYAGIRVQGSANSPFAGFGGGLMLHTKTDKVYTLDALQAIKGGVFFEAGTYFLIHSRKK